MYMYIKSQRSFKAVMKKIPKAEPGTTVSLAQIIRPSKYPRIIYELIPNLSVYFCNYPAEMNNNGWRCKAYPFRKNKDVIRVVGLGDSFMFGQGVSQNETYFNQMEEELNSQFPQKKWEFINTAVPGYNTVMEVETLARKALLYKPDIVILDFIGNDFDLPNFIYEFNNYLTFEKLFFFEFISKRLKLAKKEFELVDSPLNREAQSRFENDPQFVPPEYIDMVGWKSFYQAMVKLKELQKINNFDVIFVLTLLNKDEKVFNLGRELGFYTLYNTAYNFSDPTVFLSKKDNHLSMIGHKKTAELIINFMEENKIINKYLDK